MYYAEKIRITKGFGLGLRDLEVRDEYRSDRCDLIEDFYIPCLENATVYSRAVGFFSSTSIIAVSRGLTALIRSQGKMRLVASPCLSVEDVEAIANDASLPQIRAKIIKYFLQNAST